MIATSMPASARARAVAAPMPESEPVTIAWRGVKSSLMRATLRARGGGPGGLATAGRGRYGRGPACGRGPEPPPQAETVGRPSPLGGSGHGGVHNSRNPPWSSAGPPAPRPFCRSCAGAPRHNAGDSPGCGPFPGARRRRLLRGVRRSRYPPPMPLLQPASAVTLDAVELRVLHLPLVSPFTTSFGTETREVIVVTAETPGGRGWGESSRRPSRSIPASTPRARGTSCRASSCPPCSSAGRSRPRRSPAS